MRHWTLGVGLVALLALPLQARGQAASQEQAQDQAQDQSASQGTATLPAPAPGDDKMKAILEREIEPGPGEWSYSPGERRDPFVSLIKPIEGTTKRGPKPPGIEGFLINEVALKGIVKTTDGYISMIVGPDQKAYFCKVGQRLYDGSITAMTDKSVTFRQEVTDPLATVKVKDVVKSLYPSEEARQ